MNPKIPPPVWFARLEGGCMRPLLTSGDTVPVRRAAGAELGPGDIVYYHLTGQSHLHRVWWRCGRSLWIKDDAALVGLHKVPASCIEGLLDDGGYFRRGWSGLLFSLAANVFFSMVRSLKGSWQNPMKALRVALKLRRV